MNEEKNPNPDSSGATETAAANPCYVVGIGASAGGQGPLEHLFTAIPPDCGLSFVVIMHLPPEGPSFLATMLARYTTMAVVTAEEGMRLMPDTVHVIPAGREIVVSGGLLRLEEPGGRRGAQHPIDRFFRSLAEELKERAIAVVLSGAGTDGAKGGKEVRDAGGIVVVQEPGSAINAGMPGSAIATGAADFILPVEEIPGKIAEIARGTCALSPRKCRTATLDEELQTIFGIVKARTGNDFSSYKANTVMRRIERRMAVNEAGGLGRYIALLEENAQEAQALAQDILIGVTSFFRDQEAFAAIQRVVVPRLFADRDPDDPVRIWHPCCATGEEAYSMAFLIREYLNGQRRDARVQIFATDIDEAAIAQARAGIYPDDIEADLGEERLKAFFTRTDSRWQVVKSLREMIVFAHHSLLKNPPFSRLDLLVCRNFLIYLNPDMQKRLISLFHQVLKPGGFLFLGSAETVGRHSDLFSIVDKKWKIFQRLEGGRRTDTLFPFAAPVRGFPMTARLTRPAEAFEPSPGTLAEKLLLERYSPPCVVVNEKYEVVHVSTRTNRFLEVPVGEPTRDILRLARTELRPPLRAAIYKAFTEQKEVAFRGVKVTIDGKEMAVNVLVAPTNAAPPAEKLAMVVFEPTASPPAHHAPGEGEVEPVGDETSRETLIRQLEEQLHITHEQLQATTEQLETSNAGFLSANEELISMNEEFQSANEELQSTNEELETSKEELQALNEELVTVNAELQGKVEELNQATSDMENLLTSSEIATLFLDRRLTIKRFTPAVAAIFDLIPADIGRPFRHFGGKFDWSTFNRDAETVLAGQPFAEQEVATLSGERCYLKRIYPYRNPAERIDGIVVTFIDITERKRAEEALKESEGHVRRKLESILSPEGELEDLDLADIIDARPMQSLMDNFYKLTRMPMGMIDLKGKVLVGVGWQDVCTKFHRVHPETCRNCIESDTLLSAGVPQGEFKLYKCKNNMWDVATPIIVGGRQFGNFFMGQFLFEDEPLDYEFFRSQARQYGFNEEEYIAALEKVPRLSRESLASGMAYFMELAEMISKLSYSNLKLARSLAERDALMDSLRESEERFRNMFERHNAVMLLIEPESGAIVDANAAATKFYGHSRENLRGLKIQELNQLPPDEVAAERRRALKEQRNHFVFPHRIATGEVRWVEVYSTPIEAQGKSLLFSIIHDVTDRERAEEAVHQSEERYRTLFNTLMEGFCIIEVLFDADDRPIDYRFLECNPAFEAQTGLRYAQGKLMRELAPEHDAHWFEIYGKVALTGEPARFTNEAKELNRWYEVSAYQVEGRDSHKVAILFNDITETKRAEQALRESELFYRQTLESIPAMVFTTRPDGYCDFQSQQWVDFTGVPMIEHLGDGWNRLLHPDDRPRAFAAWRAAVEERGPYDLEYRVRRHDGEYEWFKVRGRPIRNEAGEIVRWFGTALNIDHLLKAQAELQQAKEAAEAANRAKRQFLANMSHELRTPMTGVLGTLDLTLNGPLDPQQREFLCTAHNSARSLMRILNDILDLTKVEAGILSMEEKPFALSDCVVGAVDILIPEARRKGLDLIRPAADDLRQTVVGDQFRLRQILTNLIGNAVKFTERGKVEVRVAAGEKTAAGKREVTFTVVDTGIGIPADKQHLLFRSFSQVDDSDTRGFGGTGLGLAISREIAQRMGGTISFESEEGVGSTFTFTVPLGADGIEIVAAPETGTEEPAALAVPLPVMGEKPRLLLAEDDPITRKVIGMMLQRSNYDPDFAENGSQAVEMWEKGEYDLILMDMQMPRMDGFEATRAIREKERERGGHIPIVALTAHALKEDEDKCIAAGMDAYLAKPINFSKCLLVIGELLRKKVSS